MRKFLIATHGTFAKGILSTLETIIGPQENVFLIQAYTYGNESLQGEIENVLKQVKDGDELIVFSDLMGGSVTNQLLQFALKENIYIISGFNLPLLLYVILADIDTPVLEVIETGISSAKDQIVFMNKLVSK
jgi:fructoselysine/glucoselysine PTS system EIIA component